MLLILICITSVSAQDSSGNNLTLDESSHTDISQLTIENDHETGSVENSESSANEQNSLNDSHSVSEIKSVTSNEKLGVSNDNEVLTGGYESGKTYSHDYNYPFWVNDAKTFLSHFKHVTKGMYGEGRNDIIVYWTPLESTSNGQYRMYLVYDTSDVSKIHKHTVGSRNKNTADGFVSFGIVWWNS